MNKRVLVTGGAGFIGSHTVDALVKKGYKIKILDSLTKPVHQRGSPDYLNKEAEFIDGDVRNKSAWEKALKNVSIVFHLAAYQDYLPNFSKYFDVNAKGTALLYEIIVEKKLKIEKVIIASSQAIYGEGRYACKNNHIIYPTQRSFKDLKKKKWDFNCPHDKLPLIPQWVNEGDFIDPHNQYGISKYSQEKIGIHLGKRYQIPTVAMRYSIVQGPRQSPFNLYSGVLRIFITHLLGRKPPTIFEDGNQIRDFVNIHDVVSANILVLENKKADYQVFNVGGGKRYTVNEFYKIVQKILKTDIKPVRDGSFRVGDTRHIFSSIEKMKNLGFKPTYSITDSIHSYITWLQTLANFNNGNSKMHLWKK
ncbi:SDR family NAD(P)-dependent oxidoreductase [Candidatus Roizmanbacteria bacterium]|nr:SDR family NAD(P)-dependent oxidoreductase [Candidatus Roizmanbacteria bacterium]